MNYYKENEKKSIALIFSCPGNKEKEECKPCAGTTGKNLNVLIDILNGLSPSVFPPSRIDYHINNAWDKVESIKITGKTVASNSDILEKSNLNRLEIELKNSKIIICFGKKSLMVINHLKDNKQLPSGALIIKSRHLGMQSINQIQNDFNDIKLKIGEKSNTKKRLNIIAKEIIQIYRESL
jgi:uracil-DNA glycosylase